MTHGVMVANCVATPEAFSNGVGRQTPTAADVPTIPRTPRNGGGGGAVPSVRRHAQILSATLCPQVTPACIDLALSAEASAAIEASWRLFERCDLRRILVDEDRIGRLNGGRMRPQPPLCQSHDSGRARVLAGTICLFGRVSLTCFLQGGSH